MPSCRRRPGTATAAPSRPSSGGGPVPGRRRLRLRPLHRHRPPHQGLRRLRPPGGLPRALAALAAPASGGVNFPHWLGKAFRGDDFVDVIFSPATASPGRRRWFEHAVPGEVLGMPVRLCPAEEMIWSKAFIMERERFDGADVAHLLRARPSGSTGSGCSPASARTGACSSPTSSCSASSTPASGRVPAWVMRRLSDAWPPSWTRRPPRAVCHGTLLSREQYLTDVQRWGYRDARLPPRGEMTQARSISGRRRIVEAGARPPGPGAGLRR